MVMRQIYACHLGTRDYKEVWDLQTALHDYLVRRKRGLLSPEETAYFPEDTHFLIVCDHPPVYTLGKSGDLSHLILNESEIGQQGFQFYKINRGGDITYHGPGQIILYPILDLEDFFRDVHRYVRTLEEIIIKTLEYYQIDAFRDPAYTGVWVPFEAAPAKRKICAIGVHLSRWVSMHGLAFNVQPQLSHFKNIIPCGISDVSRDVCSMEQLLQPLPSVAEIQDRVLYHFSTLFETPVYVKTAEEIFEPFLQKRSE